MFLELLTLKQEGVAEFGISLLHVAEVLNPDNRDYSGYHRHTGKVIHALTNGNAFPYLSEALDGSASFPNGGLWFPKQGVDGLKGLIDEKYIKKTILEQIGSDPAITRQQRRAVTKPKNLAEFFHKSDFELPPLFDVIGFSKRDIAILISSPALKRRDLRDRLMRFLSDPRYYCEAISSVRPGENPVRELLDQFFETAKCDLLKLQDALREYKDVYEGAQKNAREIEEIEKRHLGAKGSGTKRAKEQLKQMRREKNAIINGISIPLDPERFSYLRSYFEGLYRVDGDSQPSEVIDLLHLGYHSDVDLIRVDGRVAEILKNDPLLKGKLVSRLSDLPKEIDRIYQTIG
ncbi:hypothetical protein [Aliiroseovarius sp.]|uniref:hypothetical protein n=1 Tax=Aliiroseovarius sp. TaxID=1872442 RepID=UPI003BAB2F25